uniref:Uncharacterized protein n=1 Tax=Rhizophora mucronata TaxID=61149 RepID=A0A2P2KKL8_RHIMU
MLAELNRKKSQVNTGVTKSGPHSHDSFVSLVVFKGWNELHVSSVYKLGGGSQWQVFVCLHKKFLFFYVALCLDSYPLKSL